MSRTQSHGLPQPLPGLDQLIEYTQDAIQKQEATLQSFTVEGHEAPAAAKDLTQMVANLAALMRRRRGCTIRP
jgi:hypothetical protein